MTTTATSVGRSHVPAATGEALSGTWINQRNSTLALTQDAEGNLRGTYTTGADRGVGHPLVGFSSGSAPGQATTLGFVVRWESDRSVTAWSGRYDPASGEISATWLLTRNEPWPAAAEDWKSTLVGHDTFHRQTDDQSRGRSRR